MNASDTACEVSATESGTGSSTFHITNNGSKVTEFYVYGEGDRVMGEVENISPDSAASSSSRSGSRAHIKRRANPA